eukprot:CAMPEP_0170483280 /NCGR_PEP_ID=MMETSP0208-20121228/2972_1 /TAXON_ID=197538 /ORGANISM="Strombidium inclinatum, Strain S3" /LENGTH=217 /DNA_ID=CAMNT_0010756247 /DNA_START=3 /DNA_END=652 /DNA_ORIENTATION=-
MTDFNFSVAQVEELQNMLNINGEEEEEQGHVFGSALNPGTLHGGKDKEVAKPGVKMNVAVNNRNKTGGAIISEEEKKEKVQKEKDTGKHIWTEEEVNIRGEERPDDRPQPEFEVLHKQHVGTEDIYLGLSDRDPSSTHCDSLLVKVELPGTKFANVDLDIKGPTKQQLVVQAPNWYLSTMLPYPVNKEKGKAKFDSDKGLLEVTLPAVRETFIEQLL